MVLLLLCVIVRERKMCSLKEKKNVRSKIKSYNSPPSYNSDIICICLSVSYVFRISMMWFDVLIFFTRISSLPFDFVLMIVLHANRLPDRLSITANTSPYLPFPMECNLRKYFGNLCKFSL